MRVALMVCGLFLAGCAGRASIVGTWEMEGATDSGPMMLEIRDDHTWAARSYNADDKRLMEETVGEWQEGEGPWTIDLRTLDGTEGGTAKLQGRDRMITAIGPAVPVAASTQPASDTIALPATMPVTSRSMFKRVK